MLARFDLFGNRIVFIVGIEINQIVAVNAGNGTVCRNDNDVNAVNFGKLFGFRFGGSRHTGDFFVKTEVILKGNGRQRPIAFSDGDVFFRFNGLVQSFGITSADQNASGKLVNNFHLSVLNHVINIALKHFMRPHSLCHVVRIFEILGIKKRSADDLVRLQQRFELQHTLIGKSDAFALFVCFIIADTIGVLLRILIGRRIFLHLFKISNQIVDLREFRRIIIRLTGNDQRRSRFINQNRVDFIDNAVMVTALNFLLNRPRHVIAQIIETELVVGSVSDIAAVRLPLGIVIHVGKHCSDGDSQQIIHRSHPISVALCQIIVDSNDMNAFTAQRIEVRRRYARQRLSFTGLHFGDLSVVQDDSAHQLNVVMAFAEFAPRRFPNQGKRFRQQGIQRFSLLPAPFP